MWCYLVNEIVIIAVNLDQSPLLLDIHYASLTHKLLFGYNNFGSGLFGIALFSWHRYSHSVHCNNKNCSTNIHSHSFVCTIIILLIFCPSYNCWLASPLVLFYFSVMSACLTLDWNNSSQQQQRCDEIGKPTTEQSTVCEMAQGLTSTYSHTLARTHQDELRIPSNATGLPKRMQLGSQRLGNLPV